MLSTVADLAARWVDVLVWECLYVSIVFGVVIALSFLLRRRGPAVHLALWSLVFVRLVQMVYFFHPLVWFSGVRLNSEREKLCDATAVAAGRMTARDYVGGLLNVLRLDLQGAGAPTMTARKMRIEVRIRNVFDRDGGTRPRLVTALAAACAVGVFLLPVASDGGVAMPTGESDSEEG